MTNYIEHISSKSKGSEIFISCLSYEDRTLASFYNFSKGFKPTKVIQFQMSEFMRLKNVKNNKKIIRILLQKKGITLEPLLCTWSDAVSHVNSLINKFLPLIDTDYLTIDISTFPKNLLLSIFRLLEDFNFKVIRLIYWSPKIYGTEIGEWLTRGISQIEPLPMFSGTPISGKKKVLITFLGFENERAYKIWEEYEPAQTILVLGHPSTERHWENISYFINQKIIIQSNAKLIYNSAKDPIKTNQFLNKIYNETDQNKFDIVIAPLGPKIQLIGVYKFAYEHPDIQITYAYPTEYNINNYSKGWGKKYEFNL